jgi:hypothetical protein
MRELALLLADGTVVRDPSWRCVADVHGSFHGFGVRKVYGVIVDAETLVQVYPPEQLMAGTAGMID